MYQAEPKPRGRNTKQLIFFYNISRVRFVFKCYTIYTNIQAYELTTHNAYELSRNNSVQISFEKSLSKMCIRSGEPRSRTYTISNCFSNISTSILVENLWSKRCLFDVFCFFTSQYFYLQRRIRESFRAQESSRWLHSLRC